jgi:glycosyltransferase involved in cell wall biosynthesis
MAIKPKSLSLVIPAYNEERYIGACLDAVAAQSVMPDEVIVVDNNSKDSTIKIAEKYPFVTLIHEKRQGLRFSRNTGLDEATGDILGRIDADTMINPEWVKRVKHAFSGAHPVDAMTGPCYYHDMPFREFGFMMDKLFRSVLYKENDPVLYGSNMAISRQVWHDIRDEICQDGEFFEDLDLTIHLEDHDYHVKYDQKLVVGVSARRLDDSPVDFYKNMQHFDATYDRHGIEWSGARNAKRIYYTSYVAGKGFRLIYDADKKSVTFKKLFKPLASRPNSNT